MHFLQTLDREPSVIFVTERLLVHQGTDDTSRLPHVVRPPESETAA